MALTATKARKKVEQARGHVPEALLVLGELERAVSDGLAIHLILAHCEELRAVLLSMEDAVGAVTPASLFEGVQS